MITPEQIKSIQEKQRDGIPCDDELMVLFDQNQRLISHMMKGYISELEDEDLRQEAFLAMLDALNKYDEEKGATFADYWCSWMRARFTRMRESWHDIPAYLMTGITKYKRLVSSYEAQTGNPPSDEDILKAFGGKVALVERIKASLELDGHTSLDKEVGGDDDEGFSLVDTIASDRNIEEECITAVFYEELQKVWDILGEILSPEDVRKFKLTYCDGLTFSEAAEAVGITPSKFHTDMARSMNRLRAKKNRFLPYWKQITDDVRFDKGVKKCGVRAFRESKTSSTERAAFFGLEKWERKWKRIENDLRKQTYIAI